MTEDSTLDLTPESPAPADKQSNNTLKILLIVGGVGCGCLVLPIVVGIIAAIALPSFLNQANTARESEARNIVSSLARAQQAYFLDTGELASAIEPLQIGIQPETENYSYGIAPQPDGSAAIVAIPKVEGLSGFVGGVFVVGSGSDTTTVTGICEADEPAIERPPLPSLNATSTPPAVQCAPGTSPL